MTRGLDNRPIVGSVLGPILAFGMAATLVLLLQPSLASPAAAQSDSGATLYAQHCASCHQAAGGGIEGTFPPLVGNPEAADADYVEAVIVEGLSGPIEVAGVSYDSLMPPVAGLTDQAEIDAVVEFVVGLAAQGAATSDSPAEGQDADDADDVEDAGPVIGDSARGKDYFLGSSRFENGGAACVACHTAGDVGNLNGPGLGPDLTSTFDTLGGEPGLSGWLASPPSPTMQPLFVDRALTEAEVADIVAFLDGASGQPEQTSNIDRLALAGVAGLGLLIAGMLLAWRGMRQTYVQRLASRSGNKPKSTPGLRRPGPANDSSQKRPPLLAQARRSRQ